MLDKVSLLVRCNLCYLLLIYTLWNFILYLIENLVRTFSEHLRDVYYPNRTFDIVQDIVCCLFKLLDITVIWNVGISLCSLTALRENNVTQILWILLFLKEFSKQKS